MKKLEVELSDGREESYKRLSQARTKARIMQDTKFFETSIRRRDRARWSGALGSLRKGGEKEQGSNEGLLEALHDRMGTGVGKNKRVRLRGG